MGAGGVRVAMQHPAVVRKLVLLSVSYTLPASTPASWTAMGEMQPEMMHGLPWHDEYMRIAPRPEDFRPAVCEKGRWTPPRPTCPPTLRAISSPVLVIAGDLTS